MLQLYHDTGARDFEVIGESRSLSQWATIRDATCQLLEERWHNEIADYLRKWPFGLFDATNHFGDEFAVLLAAMPIPEYVRISSVAAGDEYRQGFHAAATALAELGHAVRFIAIAPEVRGAPEIVAAPAPSASTATVERALRDAQVLLEKAGATSAVDRVHTAIHAYLRELCRRADVPCSKDPTVAELFKNLREHHPAFAGPSAHDAEMTRMLRAIATILDSSTTLRNRASGAHPNEQMLAEPEAILVINAVRTLLHYLDAKTS